MTFSSHPLPAEFKFHIDDLKIDTQNEQVEHIHLCASPFDGSPLLDIGLAGLNTNKERIAYNHYQAVGEREMRSLDQLARHLSSPQDLYSPVCLNLCFQNADYNHYTTWGRFLEQ